MALQRTLGVAGAALLLGAGMSGCQSLSGGDSLRTEPVVEQADEPGCQGETCASVSADYLRFPEAPALSRALEQRLFGLASGLSENPDGNAMSHATSFDDFAGQVFKASRQAHQDVPEMPGFEAELKADVVAERAQAKVIELDGYLYSGGAHGLPLTEYLVVDRDTRQIVELSDMLQPGQRPAYEQALERAHGRWLDTDQGQGLSAAQWPFVASDNAAPLDDGLAVKYQVYDLGPYAIGQPQLVIPYAELEGVLKPEYLH